MYTQLSKKYINQIYLSFFHCATSISMQFQYHLKIHGYETNKFNRHSGAEQRISNA